MSKSADKSSLTAQNTLFCPNPLNQFHLSEDELRLALVTTQYALRDALRKTHKTSTKNKKPAKKRPTGLLILVNGMEMSGKGESVSQFRQWVDPRLLKVEATVGKNHDADEPIWQRHTKKLPRHGDVGVYFGNWYADLITTALTKMHNKENWQKYLSNQLNSLADFEADLVNNGTHLLKCWFHVDAQILKKRLHDDLADPIQLYHMDWADTQAVAEFNDIANDMLSQQTDWLVIDGTNAKSTPTMFAHHALHAMQNAVYNRFNRNDVNHHFDDHDHQRRTNTPFVSADVPDRLTTIDDPNMDKSAYKQQLVSKQQQLAKLLRQRGNRHVVFAFEGMDAAGKGGSIKRLVAPLDPREYVIHNINAPMQYELDHPYLWRFWTRLPSSQLEHTNRIVIFDRTWYGRVLVERVEGFASEEEWQRAYAEINRFEADLSQSGTIILKYWLAIDKKEQLKRFKDRENTPHKHHKITEEDWRNRDKWQDYVQAAADMLARTNSNHAPWHLIATNDKRTARLMVLDDAINRLSKALG